MLGLAYECEPTLDRLAAHYGEALELRHAMVVLVHDVADFMTMEECALFHNADVLGFIADAKKAFAKAELIFDATNTKGLEYTNRYVKKTGNASALMHCAIDDPTAFAREAGCELIELLPFYADARRILKGKGGLYAKIAMAVTDRSGRAFLLHMRL